MISSATRTVIGVDSGRTKIYNFDQNRAGEDCDHGYAQGEAIPHFDQSEYQKAEVRPRRRQFGRSGIAPVVVPGPNGVAQPDFDIRL
jgi:hypothetical protein